MKGANIKIILNNFLERKKKEYDVIVFKMVNSKVNHQLSGSPMDHFHISLDLFHE